MNIQFSLICPTIRPYLWMQFYNSIKDTKINYEIIFVGSIEPNFELPSNIKFIKSTTKPSQCTHIGFIEAKGEIVSLTADDAQYFSPNRKSAIDNMYEFIKNFPESNSYNPKKIAYGFRMFEDKFCIETSHNHYLLSNDFYSNNDQPLLYPFFAIYKDLYLEMEGYDNRFICGQAENDFLLRIVAKYGNTESSLCPIAMVWADHEDHKNSGKFREYHSTENAILKKLWLFSQKYRGERTDKEVRKYIDKNLYTISQGEKGEWI